METKSSYLEEDDKCKHASEHEEEDKHEIQREENGAPLKEEPGAQKQQSSWTPSFFYKMDREVHHFAGHDILIQEAQDSFAATTWPAATALCQYLESHYKELNLVDKAVLEIGSGTGLVSIVAALLGAWVTATDLPNALGNLKVNLSKNTRGKSKHTPQVAALSWGFNLESTYPTSVYHYDYVLGADIVYHHDFLKELLDTMKHFCQPGTTLLWANKMRMENDLEFMEKFKKTFNTKLIFEEGDMKIFMATCREDGEEKDAEDLKVESACEPEIGNNMEKVEAVVDRNEEEAALSYAREDSEEPEDEENNNEDIKADVLKDGPDDMNNNMKKVQGSIDRSEEEVTLSEEEEEEEEEEDEDDKSNGDEDKKEEPAHSPDQDSKDTTQGEQKKVNAFPWAPNIISCLGKEVYHYVGTDINIYEAFDSYGAVLWPGALALCSFLEHNRDIVNLKDKEVLELGAGTGLVAIVASLLGAKVMATDLPEILGNLRANVMRNTRGKTKHLPQICPLPWSFDVGRTYPSALYKFDYVLAADVVYHHEFLNELLATMAHFCHPRTTIIWANKVRLESDLKFTEKFKKEFDTTLLAEDGEMKIFMGKFKM